MGTAVENPRTKRSANARAFAAGTGVTFALIAAAVVAFASIAAFVAFEGMPFASGEAPESSVTISGAPRAAALAAVPAGQAVASKPATPSPAAAAELNAALPGATPSGAATDPGATVIGGRPFDPSEPPGPGPGTDPDPPLPPPTPPAGTGPIQGVVNGVDDAMGLGLGNATQGLTKRLDDAVVGALNDTGSRLGAGNLGDKLNGAVNGRRGGLLD